LFVNNINNYSNNLIYANATNQRQEQVSHLSTSSNIPSTSVQISESRYNSSSSHNDSSNHNSVIRNDVLVATDNNTNDPNPPIFVRSKWTSPEACHMFLPLHNLPNIPTVISSPDQEIFIKEKLRSTLKDLIVAYLTHDG
jgi:hypothetical protein